MTTTVLLHGPGRLPRRVALALQVALVLGLLLLWEFVPRIPGLASRSPLFDAFFISSPTRVVAELVRLSTGAQGTTPIGPFIRETVQAALIGTVIGTFLGGLAGLLLSNDERLNQVLRPLVVASNAIPRIALVPIIVIIFGPNAETSVLTAVMVVFFLVFFNAYEGGRSVPVHVFENALILRASPMQVMWHIRLPYVAAWTLASLPNAVSFGLISVVTAEILTGYPGLGRLLVISVATAASSLTFAVVLVVSIIGLVLVTATELLRRRWLHWWSDAQDRAQA